MKKIITIIFVLIVVGVLIYLPKVLKKSPEQELIGGELPVEVFSRSVLVENFAFAPLNLEVKKGTMITWVNRDSVGHTVTADSGTGPDSTLLGQGQSYSYTFNSVGTYAYHCTPHPYMRATVTVTE